MKRNALVKDVKPYSLKELCEIYQVSNKTMKKWLKPIAEDVGERQGNIYTVAQVHVIFKHLGVPGVLE